MKTKHAMIVLGALLLAILPVALAQEEGTGSAAAEIDEDTQKEIEAASSIHGAKVRLLQLQKAIDKNLAEGNKAVAEIKQLNTTANTTTLEQILEEMTALKAQVTAAPLPEPRTAAQKFADYKHDATELSKEFRAEVKAQLNPEQVNKIKAAAKKERNTTKAELEQRIRAEINEHNAERIKTMLNALGTENESLVAKVRAGEIAPGQAIAAITTTFNSLTAQEKKEALARIKEDLLKRSVLKKAVIDDLKQNYSERKRERALERAQSIKNPEAREKAKLRIQNTPAKTKPSPGREVEE
ncbi:hypothetical protein HY640_04330 [Candidatus Woesearchaeota archaeon]|nr:hypothetical protein [Candidatus Woesearchaeota archaeon]